MRSDVAGAAALGGWVGGWGVGGFGVLFYLLGRSSLRKAKSAATDSAQIKVILIPYAGQPLSVSQTVQQYTQMADPRKSCNPGTSELFSSLPQPSLAISDSAIAPYRKNRGHPAERQTEAGSCLEWAARCAGKSDNNRAQLCRFGLDLSDPSELPLADRIACNCIRV